MASDYGLNFGFRRSHEGLSVREGRQKTPKTGSPLRQGAFVTLDAANPGFLTLAGADPVARAGINGLLVQEEVWDRSIYEADRVTSFDLGVTKRNRLSVILGGAGTKFWLKNTAAQTRVDGREVPAVQMFVPGAFAIGSQVTWNGTAYALRGTGVGVATVSLVKGTDYIECVLNG